MIPAIKFTHKTLQLIIDTLPIGIFIVDLEGIIVFSNNKIEDILGFNDEELFGISVNNLVPVHLKKSHTKMLKHFTMTVSDRSMASGRILAAINKDGVEVPCQIGLKSLLIDEGTYIMVSMIETTNSILKVASYSDPLTGLPNRIFFDEVSESLRNLAIRNNTPLALMFIDLDNFKYVNDQFGHDIGDLVLTKVADIFTCNIRKNDTIGRIGGDEFVICLYGISNKGELEALSKKLITEISLINNVNNHAINIGASIGAIFAPTAASLTVNNMINKADKLMYQAKQASKGTSLVEEISA